MKTLQAPAPLHWKRVSRINSAISLWCVPPLTGGGVDIRVDTRSFEKQYYWSTWWKNSHSKIGLNPAGPRLRYCQSYTSFSEKPIVKNTKQLNKRRWDLREFSYEIHLVITKYRDDIAVPDVVLIYICLVTTQTIFICKNRTENAWIVRQRSMDPCLHFATDPPF